MTLLLLLRPHHPTLVTVSLSASFTPAGAPARSVSRSLPGALTMTGSVTRVFTGFRTLTASITPSGSLSRILSLARTLTATITPAGSLTRTLSLFRTITAAFTPSGSLATRISAHLTLALSGALTFIGGTNLYPDPNLYPGGDIYPYGGAILVQVNRTLAALIQAAGSLSEIPPAHAFARTFNGVLQPHVVFFKISARVFLAAQFSSAALFGVRASRTTAQALFASLRAAGSFHSIVNPGYVAPGGGGFGVPMPDAFFLRYKPTLRRQKVKL